MTGLNLLNLSKNNIYLKDWKALCYLLLMVISNKKVNLSCNPLFKTQFFNDEVKIEAFKLINSEIEKYVKV